VVEQTVLHLRWDVRGAVVSDRLPVSLIISLMIFTGW
jgi:hypothetical protein